MSACAGIHQNLKYILRRTKNISTQTHQNWLDSPWLPWTSAQNLIATGPVVVRCNEKHGCCIKLITSIRNTTSTLPRSEIYCTDIRFWHFLVCLIRGMWSTCQSQLTHGKKAAQSRLCAFTLHLSRVIIHGAQERCKSYLPSRLGWQAV